MTQRLLGILSVHAWLFLLPMWLCGCSGTGNGPFETPGDNPPPPGGGSGFERQFDEYPLPLSIEGSSVFESGESRMVQVVADNNEYRGAGYLTVLQAETVQASSGRTATTPGSTLALGHPTNTQLFLRDQFIEYSDGTQVRAPDDFLEGSLSIEAPTVGATTRFMLEVENPRGRVQREITVVPPGTAHIRTLAVGNIRRDALRGIVYGDDRVNLAVELSAPSVGEDTFVEFESSSTRIQVPERVSIPAGRAGIEFSVVVVDQPGQEYVTITATMNGISQQTSVWARSSAAFVLKLNVNRHYSSILNSEPIAVLLSRPAPPGGLTLNLSSNNSLVGIRPSYFLPDFSQAGSVTIPPGISRWDSALEFTRLNSLSAVRITAQGGGVTRIADAVVGVDIAATRIVSLDVRAGLDPPIHHCLETEESGHIVVHVTLNGPAPPGGFAVNLQSSRPSVLPLRTTFVIPEGETNGRYGFRGPTDIAADDDVHRFVKIVGRSVITLEEASDWLFVSEDDLGSTTEGMFEPHITLDREPVTGGRTIKGRVTLGRTDPDTGELLEANPHPFDDVPVTVSVSIAPGNSFLGSQQILIPAGFGSAPFEFDLDPQAVATDVIVRARTAAYGGSGICGGPFYERTVRLEPGGTLKTLSAGAFRHVFNGDSGTVSVVLTDPAPASGVTVQLTTDVAPEVLSIPASVSIPAGQQRADVPFVTNNGVPGDPGFVFRDVRVTATFGNSVTQIITLMPAPSAVLPLLSPNNIVGSEVSILTVTTQPRYPVPVVAQIEFDDSMSRVLTNEPPLMTLPAYSSRATVPVGFAHVVSPTEVSFLVNVRGTRTRVRAILNPVP